MKRPVNLLPSASQRLFEQLRQAQLWCAVWFATAVLLAAGYGLLDHRRRLAQSELEAVQAALAPLRRAEDDARRLEVEGRALGQRAEVCRALEQTDVPLALLQVVGDSCRNLGASIKLESLRMNEAPVGATAAGQKPAPRKQLLLTGSADADARVAALVGRLQESKAFSQVELESSQAQTEQAGSIRSFQIRCRQ